MKREGDRVKGNKCVDRVIKRGTMALRAIFMTGKAIESDKV